MPRLSKIGAAALAAFGWTSGSAVTASYLVVAGGGGGGTDNGGGGGAGGYLETSSASLNPTLSYTVIVGAGGAGGASPSGGRGSTGSDSSFSASTANGGGGGGGPATSSGVGGNGGSAGGGDGFNAAVGGTATQGNSGGATGYGNNGGNGTSGGSGRRRAGGGGGANAVGSNGGDNGSQGGNGGNGRASSITGTSVTYAGGGGGGSRDSASTGGTGGGGAGGGQSVAGTAGTANTGGGAGGGGDNGAGAQGGSGIVIISYVGAQQFGGGVVTSSGGNTIHTFTTSGTLSPLSSLTVSCLVVAGGGAGGGDRGGGGGAGGYRTSSGLTIDTNSIYLVTVGAGGASVVTDTGGSGSNSQFLSTTSAGGGGGGVAANGVAGGSGGGGWGASGTGPFTGGAGNTPSTSPSQGNNGGTGESGGDRVGGGGGGASAVGADGTSNGAGGAGTASSISGTSVTYAGGGGGGGLTAPVGTGGAGGGGAGVTSGSGNAGTANLGGGGGGAGDSGAGRSGGNGGSGIVIISYPGSTQQMAGGTVTVAGGNVIHTFTSSGYLTPIVLVNNSLRFRSSASAYLSRTFPVAGNRRTYTLSLWVKRGSLGGSTNQVFFGSGVSTTAGSFYFLPTDQLEINPRVNNTNTYITTTQVFRDPSAWYHIVIALDTTQATDSNRLKLYINGVQVTAFSATIYPALNGDSTLNNNIAHWIGRYPEPGFPSPFDGYLAEYNFIDGQALTPNSFGTSNGLGVWQPIRYGGSYGTNGFYLPFTNTTSTSTLGNDFSGNSNTWTVNNISLTSGSTYDSMTDVPTNTNSNTANYCVFNPLEGVNSLGSNLGTFADGNLNYSVSASGGNAPRMLSFSTIHFPRYGKWYAEFTNISNRSVGIIYNSVNQAGVPLTNYNTVTSGGGDYNNGTITSGAYVSFTTSDIIGVAYDVDAATLTFYKNGTQFIAFGSITTSIDYCFGSHQQASGSAGTVIANFGQRPFAYTPPTSFVALNTFNLPTPTIGATASTTANKYFDATLYTGNGSNPRAITGLGFQPDFVWLKNRSAGWGHRLSNAVVGANYALETNNTNAELFQNQYGYLTSFNSDGFTVTAGSTDDYYTNNSGEAYVAWNWKANGSGVTNTAGSITSTVSANTTAGFSIVTYSGAGGTSTVGHGLGVAPSMIIAKRRNGAFGWPIYHRSLGNGNSMELQSTLAQFSTITWGNTNPTSSVFTIQTAGGGDINQVGGTYVAYCFAQVAGYSAFGSYTGNGSSDGTFVFTGFRPRYVLIKRTDTTGAWCVYDTSRNTYNTADLELNPNSSAAENSGNAFDILSNGFKCRDAFGAHNASGGTYVYACFAENPFKYANAR